MPRSLYANVSCVVALIELSNEYLKWSDFELIELSSSSQNLVCIGAHC